MSFTIAKGMVAQTAGKHYPAPITAVKTIEAAARFGREEALNLENKSFVPLAHTNEARALVGIFLNDQYVKGKAKKLTKDVETPKQAAVLGAGIMGGGIAYQSAWKGVPVVMKDINDKSLTLGMTEAAKLLNKQLERGKIDGLKLAGVISTIHPTLDYAGFDRVDVVVEAVVENPKVKKAVLAETEQKVRPDTVLASNTSTIPISELANALERPENFCGMHFFNPVHRMPLVEIIRGEKSSDETIAKVVAWASKMGKTPIVVNDCPGFFVNRVLFPYFAGFSQLLRDGADFRKIDKVMEKQFGWPMGRHICWMSWALIPRITLRLSWQQASRSGCRKITAMPSTRCLMPTALVRRTASVSGVIKKTAKVSRRKKKTPPLKTCWQK